MSVWSILQRALHDEHEVVKNTWSKPDVCLRATWRWREGTGDGEEDVRGKCGSWQRKANGITMAVFTEEAWNGTGGLSTYFDVFTIFPSFERYRSQWSVSRILDFGLNPILFFPPQVLSFNLPSVPQLVGFLFLLTFCPLACNTSLGWPKDQMLNRWKQACVKKRSSLSVYVHIF